MDDRTNDNMKDNMFPQQRQFILELFIGGFDEFSQALCIICKKSIPHQCPIIRISARKKDGDLSDDKFHFDCAIVSDRKAIAAAYILSEYDLCIQREDILDLKKKIENEFTKEEVQQYLLDPAYEGLLFYSPHKALNQRIAREKDRRKKERSSRKINDVDQ